MYDIMIATEVFDACIMEESQNYRHNTNDYYVKGKQCVRNMSKIMASSQSPSKEKYATSHVREKMTRHIY